MRKEAFALAAVALAAAGCAGPGKTTLESPPPAQVEAPPQAPQLLAVSEPLGCPLYAGDDRPDYDAQSLHCIVEWMRQARDYLARGGKPTQYTNEAAFKRYKGSARRLQARLDKFLAQARWQGAAAKAPPAPPGPSEDDQRRSQQSYLSGIIYFQKGDYAKARLEWNRAVQLNDANDDAKAGLERLDKLGIGR